MVTPAQTLHDGSPPCFPKLVLRSQGAASPAREIDVCAGVVVGLDTASTEAGEARE